jgi:hypothetical protein
MTERDRCMITSTVGEAESGADFAEQDDWNPDFEAELVGGSMKVFGRKHVGLCLVSHPISGGVDKLFSGKGPNRMGIEGIHVSVHGGEDRALDQVGELSVGRVVERAINITAARVIVQVVGSDHKRGNDHVVWGRQRRRRSRWRWHRVGDMKRRRRRGRPSLTDS